MSGGANNFTPNHTSPSSEPGTFWGLFGHRNINTEDNWSWEREVRGYREDADVRKAELERARHMRNTDVIRHPDKFPHLRSTFERGLEDYGKVQIGTAAMGGYSRLEAIQPEQAMPTNPILDPDSTDNANAVIRNPDRRSYDPIIGAYRDEIVEETPRFSPAPPPRPIDKEAGASDVARYAKERERHNRTQEWMPGRPKGGRSLREARPGPILGDDIDEETKRSNEEIQNQHKEEKSKAFNNIFQVHPDQKAEIRAKLGELKSTQTVITGALNRRMVREGGYDPVTLRDRRTGDAVGPLPDKQNTQKMKSVAAGFAAVSRTGANVAYALGSDRYGDPEGGKEKEQKINHAQVDHVKGLMANETRIEAGQHDLEDREIIPSNVQALMDSRYAEYFDPNEEMYDTWENRQVAKAANRTHGGAGVSTIIADYMPSLTAEDLLQNDTMTTWAPRVERADTGDKGMAYTKKIDNYQRKDHGEGLYTTATGHSGMPMSSPIRLWPEERKEISAQAKRIGRAEKGI